MIDAEWLLLDKKNEGPGYDSPLPRGFYPLASWRIHPLVLLLDIQFRPTDPKIYLKHVCGAKHFKNILRSIGPSRCFRRARKIDSIDLIKVCSSIKIIIFWNHQTHLRKWRICPWYEHFFKKKMTEYPISWLCLIFAVPDTFSLCKPVIWQFIATWSFASSSSADTGWQKRTFSRMYQKTLFDPLRNSTPCRPKEYPPFIFIILRYPFLADWP